MLGSSDSTVQPGSLIEKRGRGHFAVDHVAEFPGTRITEWKTVLKRGNILQENVYRSLSLAGRFSLKELGLAIAGGLSEVRWVNFDIQDVRVRIVQSHGKLALQSEFERLEDANAKLWRKLKQWWLADKTYYAAKFTAVLETKGKVDLRAKLEGRISLAGGGTVAWAGRNTLEVKQPSEVPFAFSGWKLSTGLFE